MNGVIITEDGVEKRQGDRAFNYYDCKWGIIERIMSDGEWFLFRHDDGIATTLNGARIASYKPHWVK